MEPIPPFHHQLQLRDGSTTSCGPSIKPSPTQKLAISLSMSLLCSCLKALVPALTLSC